jgi:hypothetical protein
MSDDRAMMLPQKSLAPDRKADKHFHAGAQPCSRPVEVVTQGDVRDQSMIRKSGNRFSEKIMLKQRDEIMMRFRLIAS